MISDDKYVVFKRDDFQYVLDNIKEGMSEDLIRHDLSGMTVEDAVVIRRQDRFAANALDTYADQITALVELSEDHPLADLMDPNTRERLMSLADFFRDQAHMSRNERRKLPD